ncbi:MAG TPA: hypothetical protein PKU97_02740 [Kofleriaceae bacterium]|jgi:hypothetical protein|nr:hypothetical protein [Kofleriaceae bacterium]
MDQVDLHASSDDDDTAADSSSPKNDLLKLPDGGSSVDVYVKSFKKSGTKLAGFAKKQNGNFHTKGLTWKSSGGTLNVTFHLLGDVVSLSTASTSPVQFGPVSNGTQPATFPDQSVSESFNVNFSDGSHDPQIIISPG